MMKMKIETKMKIAFGCNLALLIMEGYANSASFSKSGMDIFRFYTEDSNILTGVVAFLFVITYLYSKQKGCEIPRWILVARHIAVSMLCVTFLVVLFVLGPMLGYGRMLTSGVMPFTHVACPIVSFLSFYFFEDRSRLTKQDAHVAIVPTVLYATILVILNLLRLTDGPYPFLRVYNQPIYMSVLWCVLILGGAYGIARLLLTRNSKA